MYLKITLYHYTNKDNAAGIQKNKLITGSTVATPTQNRRFGTGVYFTSLDPYNDPKSILLNNYDDRGRVTNSKRLWAKIEWVVEVCIDEDKVEKVEEGNRDVYLYPDGDVDLTKYQWKVYKNPNTDKKLEKSPPVLEKMNNNLGGHF
ncbi:hypothetical protein QZH41_014972 [Actinostola sp. cb2023]|nr:hypothetical protein QZH41_014972 [Actinostola sp. cb2023]